MKLIIYGEQAKQIKDGQIFIAKVDSVEGRVKVILEYDYKDGIDNQPCPRCSSTNTWYDKGDTDSMKLEDDVICKDCGCNT